ncbi:MAG: class I SAM-dependent methyltransferase [Ferruginibacter sp.]
MNPFQYLQYFFYLTFNWNVRIAYHIIKKEIAGEKKYGIQTTGADELASLDKKGIDIEHATIYMPISYDLLEDVFAAVSIQQFNHLLDIGSGKGRALCVAAHAGVCKLSGIDISKEFCDISIKNLEHTATLFSNIQYKIYNNDAFYFDIPSDVDSIFLFNPFDEVIMSAVLENIEESLVLHPRKMTIMYANPMQKHLFKNYDYKEIYHTQKLKYLEALVLTKNPG